MDSFKFSESKEMHDSLWKQGQWIGEIVYIPLPTGY